MQNKSSTEVSTEVAPRPNKMEALPPVQKQSSTAVSAEVAPRPNKMEVLPPVEKQSSTAAITEVAETPKKMEEHPPVQNWTAIAAITISIATFLKSLYSDWRTSKAKDLAAFDTQYGSPVRNGLRQFEQKLRTLRVFTLASGKGINELKEEIDELRASWEDAALEISELLSEVDSSGVLIECDWEYCFQQFTNKADTDLQSISGDDITDIAIFQARADSALNHYKAGVNEIRMRLQLQSSSYGKIKRRRR